jgi:hypothetical protein
LSVRIDAAQLIQFHEGGANDRHAEAWSAGGVGYGTIVFDGQQYEFFN